MGAEKDITVHSRLTVVPSKPTPARKVIPLSYLDHMMQRHTVRTVYYYDTSSVENRPKLQERMKESLCKALSSYPLFAGRLQKRDDGMWEVKCNDAGVRIYEATCSLSMQELMAKCPAGQLESELSRTEVNPDHTITPVAVIQFTEFSCGNLAIGFSWLHIIGDPMCGTLFMKAWGEVHRNAQILHPPFFHPPSLKPRLKTKMDVRSRDYYTSSFFNGQEEDGGAVQEYQSATLCFGHDMVEQIIAEVQNGSCKYGPPTPSDVLSALLWVAISKAQGKPGNDEAKASLCLEFRKIHLPPLPYGYVGNAVHFAGVSSTVEELISQDLSYAASIINENGAMVDTEEVRSVIDLLHEMEGAGKGVLKTPPVFYSAGLTIAIFDYFFCYDVVFDFGKPLRVAYTVEPPIGEGLVVVLPAAEGKSARNVVVSLPKHVMGNLLKDAELSRFLPELKANDA